MITFRVAIVCRVCRRKDSASFAVSFFEMPAEDSIDPPGNPLMPHRDVEVDMGNVRVVWPAGWKVDIEGVGHAITTCPACCADPRVRDPGPRREELSPSPWFAKIVGDRLVTFERTPDGHINNCALANGDEEHECQLCLGDCPDRQRLGGRAK